MIASGIHPGTNPKGLEVIDIHCHILPGLDDGAEDWSKSLEMAQIAAIDGISGIVCTPHFSHVFPGNNLTAILAAIEELRTRLRQTAHSSSTRRHTALLNGGFPRQPHAAPLP